MSANNLANASTVGFKKDGLTFNDYMTRELGVGGRRIGSMGSGAAIQGEWTEEEQGRIVTTGNPLDLAMTRPGAMFAVQTPGGIRYSRDGQFKLDNLSRLVDHSGNLVLDDRRNPISLDGEGPVTVAPTGEISQGGREVAKVGVWRGRFTKVGANDYESTDARAVSEGAIQQSATEQSNVEPVQAMVEMIRFGRTFEMNQKSIQTQDDITGKLIDVIRN